jgi:hypothetical protein
MKIRSYSEAPTSYSTSVSIGHLQRSRPKSAGDYRAHPEPIGYGGQGVRHATRGGEERAVCHIEVRHLVCTAGGIQNTRCRVLAESSSTW